MSSNFCISFRVTCSLVKYYLCSFHVIQFFSFPLAQLIISLRDRQSLFAVLLLSCLCRCRSLHLNLARRRAKISRNRLLRLQLLAQTHSLDAVEAREQANLDNARQPDQLLGQPANLPDAVLAGAVDAGLQIAGQQQRRKGRVNDPHAVVGDALAGLAGQAGADGRVGGAHGAEAAEDVGGGEGEDLDGDGFPGCAEAGGLFAGV